MEKPDSQIAQLVQEKILSNNEGAKSYSFTIVFTTGGNSSSTGILTFPEKEMPQAPLKDIRSLVKAYYEATDNIDSELFNKVSFEVFQDGAYKSNYVWDEGEIKKHKAFSAFVLPQWINERLLTLLFESGYGDIRKWQRGVFTFTIIQNHLTFQGVIYNGDKPKKVKVDLPDYVIKAIVEHHQITNEGLLKEQWQPWNQLEIRSPHNSLDLDKDVTYRLVSDQA